MTLNENHIRELLDASTPGPWTVEEDDWEEVVVGNDEGHRMVWGDQVRFKFEAGNPKADPQLAALAPELARDWLRMRNDLGHLARVLEDFAVSPDSAPADRFAAQQIHKLLNGVTND